MIQQRGSHLEMFVHLTIEWIKSDNHPNIHRHSKISFSTLKMPIAVVGSARHSAHRNHRFFHQSTQTFQASNLSIKKKLVSGFPQSNRKSIVRLLFDPLRQQLPTFFPISDSVYLRF